MGLVVSEVAADVLVEGEVGASDVDEAALVDAVPALASDGPDAAVDPEPPDPQPARSSVIPTPVAVRAVRTDVRCMVAIPCSRSITRRSASHWV